MTHTPNESSYDLIVLGTGPAGGTVARRCARAGARVAVIESRVPGGTCALRGCNPKKVLALAAELVDWTDIAGGKLIASDPATIDWNQLRDFTSRFTEEVPDSTREGFAEDGIDLFVGPPTFLDPHRLRVGDSVLRGERICLAIGAQPVVPDLPGIEHAVTSDDFFDLPTLAGKIVFAGGGYISMEFAHLATRAGCEVDVIESNPRPLDGFEPELVDALVERSQRAGISFHTDRDLKSIEKAGERYRVTMGTSHTEAHDATLECDRVVLGLGRAVDVDGLGIESAGLTKDRGFVVDDHLVCVGTDHIFAVGDCAQTSMPHLTMAANVEADRVVAAVTRALGLEAAEPRLVATSNQVPSVVFTAPNLSRIGLSEQDARERYADLRVEEGDRSSWGTVKKRGETHARYKILIADDSDEIVGAHFLGPGASEFINLIALAMQHGIGASDLAKTVFAFPTFGTDLPKLLR
ncbi:Glutathione amide reductase [Planctomycetes bacterium Poly30]|uniref:Glutathione amide reductase n=1 Tax=Saltatorellus ferox TaxID=2528018 RepID=A0A518ERE7_9BACT|nr:Glutathione amide reductase [Planctomycetes bacterium Poly30]